MDLALLAALARAGWTVETLDGQRFAEAGPELLWRVRDEEGELAEEVLDTAALDKLRGFFGVNA